MLRTHQQNQLKDQNWNGQAEIGKALREPFSITRNIYGYQRSRGKSPTYEYSALPAVKGKGQGTARLTDKQHKQIRILATTAEESAKLLLGNK